MKGGSLQSPLPFAVADTGHPKSRSAARTTRGGGTSLSPTSGVKEGDCHVVRWSRLWSDHNGSFATSLAFNSEPSLPAPLFIGDPKFEPHSCKVEEGLSPSRVPALLGGVYAALSVVQAAFCFHYRSMGAHRRAVVDIGVFIGGRWRGWGLLLPPWGRARTVFPGV